MHEGLREYGAAGSERCWHLPQVSAKYMPIYVAEFEFRYNNRENADIFGSAIARC